LEFPDLLQTKKKLTDVFCYEEKISSDDVKVIASPYRICPLGAHIDHQGGPVLGMTINACTLMAFHPSDDSFIKLRSKNYPGTVKFDLRNIPESTGSFWGVYPRAAALALQEKYVVERGMIGLLDGMLPGCGLSSSASVLCMPLPPQILLNSSPGILCTSPAGLKTNISASTTVFWIKPVLFSGAGATCCTSIPKGKRSLSWPTDWERGITGFWWLTPDIQGN
jgi:hypothetical protein